MIGDFNELMGNHEKRGRPLRHASTFILINLMIRNCGMLDFHCLRNDLSWRGRRNKEVIRCHLDIALASED